MFNDSNENLIKNFLNNITKKLWEEEVDQLRGKGRLADFDLFSNINTYSIKNNVQTINTSDFTNHVALAISDVFAGEVSVDDVNIIRVKFSNNTVFKISINKIINDLIFKK